MANRPTEVRLVSELLMSEAEDVETLAREVIDALDADRAKRETFVIRMAVGPDTFGMGPFSTRAAAERAARQMHPEASEELIKGSVARLFPVTMLNEPEVAPRMGNYCAGCGHPMVAHDWPKSKIMGCVVSGCLCGKPPAPPV